MYLGPSGLEPELSNLRAEVRLLPGDRLTWHRGSRAVGRLQGLHPEGDLAELNDHWVDIDAVEAAADGVARGSPRGLRRRLVVASSRCEPPRDRVSGGDLWPPGRPFAANAYRTR
jgi:hypothetical protein